MAQSSIVESQRVQIAGLQTDLEARKKEIARLEDGARRLVALELMIHVERQTGDRMVSLVGNKCVAASVFPNSFPMDGRWETKIETSDANNRKCEISVR